MLTNTLKDKIALITGASSGIGAATAKALAKEGASVILAARRKDRLVTLAKEINATGGEALAVESDITRFQAAEELVGTTISRYGRIDILLNNAGVMLNGPALEAPIEEWENMVRINVLGLMYVTHAALPFFKQQGTGDIVNISSVAGRTVRAGSAVYNATKWGVNAFTEALRQELVQNKLHVRTTLIEPGAVDTELASHMRPEIRAKMIERFKDIKRLDADDIADAILYAVTRPQHVSINEILIRPTEQEG